MTANGFLKQLYQLALQPAEYESAGCPTSLPVLGTVSLLNFFFMYLFLLFFIFGCVGFSLLCVGFLQLQRAGVTLRCGVQASHCNRFSCCRARALGAWPSVVVACGLSSCGSQALKHRLSSCGTWGLVAQRHVGSSRTTARTCVPCTGMRIRNHCATREAQSSKF